MAEGSNEQEITLGAGLQTVVHYGDTTIELHPDGDVEVYTNAAVHLHPHPNNAAPKAEPHVGDKMSDGTIFAGTSPETHKPMYATPADVPLTCTFNEAQKYAARLDAHGHQDWHVPTKSELNVLFQNRAAMGGFNVTGSNPTGWYWSSSQDSNATAW